MRTIYDIFMKDWHRRLIQKSAEKGINQVTLAQRTGLEPGTVRKYFQGITDQPRGDAMEKIASVLGVTTLWLRDGLDIDSTDSGIIDTQQIKVVGRAQPSYWRKASEPNEYEEAYIPLGIGGKYPQATRYALEVHGSSMDRVLRDGDKAIYISFDDIGRQYRDGDLVVAERTRKAPDNPATNETERTIKRVRFNCEGHAELWSESTNAASDEPVRIEDSDSETNVLITGLIIARYNDL